MQHGALHAPTQPELDGDTKTIDARSCSINARIEHLQAFRVHSGIAGMWPMHRPWFGHGDGGRTVRCSRGDVSPNDPTVDPSFMSRGGGQLLLIRGENRRTVAIQRGQGGRSDL